MQAKQFLAHNHIRVHANSASREYHKTIIVPPSCVLVSASYSNSVIGRAHKRPIFNDRHLHHAVEKVAVAQHVPAQRYVSKYVGALCCVETACTRPRDICWYQLRSHSLHGKYSSFVMALINPVPYAKLKLLASGISAVQHSSDAQVQNIT